MSCFYSEYCFYSPSDKNIIDFLTPENVTQIEGETLQEVRLRCPDAIKIKSDDAELFYEQSCKSDVSEIDESRFADMLNILPPVSHRFSDGCETFKISEMLTGKITSIFCHIEDRYFTFDDYYTLTHLDIRNRVLMSSAYKAKS